MSLSCCSDFSDDPMLQPLIERAVRDPHTLGLILSGSRGEDAGSAESDYDLYWVLTDGEFDLRAARGERQRIDTHESNGRYLLSVSYTCPRRLAEVAARPSWRTYAYAAAKVLVDKSGEVVRALQAIASLPEDKAQADAAGWFDAYLNAFYRSLKAWRHGDELGGRMHAANSVEYLVKTLFYLDQRWPPYHDRLGRHLDALAGQGWPAGYLQATLLDLLRTGAPMPQQELQARVEDLMRSRGFGRVLDAWGLDIERVKRFRFD